MKVFKPNDARPGDVLEWGWGRTILIVVEVDKLERRVDTVMLVPGESWMARAGHRVSTTYSNKQWKRFSRDFRYLSRGWEGVLCPEVASGDEGDTVKE